MGILHDFASSRRPEPVDANDSDNSICSPASGRVIPLSEVKDPVFAMGMLGSGLGIEPSDGVAYAPVSGVVTAVVATRHAIALKSDSGEEVLVHVGVDTVNLHGRGFKVFAEKGDRVQAGDALIAFDRSVIRDAGLDDTVIVTVTNASDFASVEQECSEDVSAGEPILTAKAS